MRPQHRRSAPQMATQGEIDLLAGYMPILVRSDCVSDWERKFCASFIARSRTRALHPTDKQIAVMRGMVTRFQEHMRDSAELIEGGDAND